MGRTHRIAWWGYQALIGGAMLVAGPVLVAKRRKHYAPTLAKRLGFGEQPAPRQDRPLWIHAVSVGEVGVAATLAQALPADLPLLVTTVTPTGQAQAEKLFSGDGTTRPATVAYLPFELGFAVERFLRRFEPRALILVEGDYWPLILEHTRRRQLAVAVVNGRVGARAFARQRRVPKLCRRLFYDQVQLFAVQTERDRQRLFESGAPEERLQVTGNLKFDTPAPQPKPQLEALLRHHAGNRAIVVAGSTMDGEDPIVLDAFAQIAERALLVLAPRHPERATAVLQETHRRGHRAVLRSDLDPATETAGKSSDEDLLNVIVLDTLGELAALYRLADVAFIGGTLVPTGGHNPLEAAHFAKPIVVGPWMENFRHMAEQFDDAKAWRRAADGPTLGKIFSEWLDDPQTAQPFGERAAALLQANRGAVDRTVELLRPMLEGEP